MKINLQSYLPILDWGKTYTSKLAVNDLVVAVIVTVMLIPQSLAYAQLAGLPAEVGLYASMIPLIVYAILGTSRSLSVGPNAMASLITLAAISPIAAAGSPEYVGATIVLTVLTGLILLILGFLKLGFITNFISFPVLGGLSISIGLQIATSQLTPILGIPLDGGSFMAQIISLYKNFSQLNITVAIIGVSTVVFLLLIKQYMASLLSLSGMSKKLAGTLAKLGPVIAIILTILFVSGLELDKQGVKILGTIPQGLPSLVFPPFELNLWSQLLTPALLLAILGYVGSMAVAQTLAAKKRQLINPDQELLALGASNLGSAISGGFPVVGGFSRSIVNFEAGAETPAAGAFTAVGIALVALFLTPLLFFLPNAALGATIFVAVLSMINFKPVIKTFAFSKPDGIAMSLTIILTLTLGVVVGLGAGIGASLVLYLYRTSRPHIAIIGQVPGTEHFRNADRNKVVTSSNVVSFRIDESIYFPNAKLLENYVNTIVAKNPALKHVVLNCSAVNFLDASGLDSLKSVYLRLKDGGIEFHLSEVKGPIMDGLKKTPLYQEMKDNIHFTHYAAMCKIDPELSKKTLEQK